MLLCRARFEDKALRRLSAMMEKVRPSTDGARPGQKGAAVTNEDLSVLP